MFHRLKQWLGRSDTKPRRSVEAYLSDLRKGPGWDVGDAEAWDEFWRGRFSATSGLPFELTSYEEIVRPLLPFIRERSLTSVLDVGCGIHLEVKAFAAVGLNAIGLDLSRLALTYARECDELARKPERFFDAADRREGGSWSYVHGDFLDPAVCPGPFDIVVARKVVQYYWHCGKLEEAIDALLGRLSERGILLVTSHGMAHTFKSILGVLSDRGRCLAIAGPRTDLAAHALNTDERLILFACSTG